MKKSISAMIVVLTLFAAFAPPAFSAEPVSDSVLEAPERAMAGSMGGAGVFLTKMKETGLTGLALVLISVVGFSFAFERLFNLRKANIVPVGLAATCDTMWKAGELDALKELSNDRPSTLARVVGLLVDHKEGSHADVANLAGDVASREMRVHLQRAYPLAVVATVSPLLGLFGTVFGMIGAFESVALAGEMGDPSIMAGDISFALITTALGLVIAVPALISYHFFRVKSNILALALEEQVNHLLIRWFPIGK